MVSCLVLPVGQAGFRVVPNSKKHLFVRLRRTFIVRFGLLDLSQEQVQVCEFRDLHGELAEAELLLLGHRVRRSGRRGRGRGGRRRAAGSSCHVIVTEGLRSFLHELFELLVCLLRVAVVKRTNERTEGVRHFVSARETDRERDSLSRYRFYLLALAFGSSLPKVGDPVRAWLSGL